MFRRVPPVRVILFALLTFFSVQVSAPQMKLRGLWIDTGYFYKLYPQKNTGELVSEIISKSKISRVNTLFVYAYNSVYGALYPTVYRHTRVEGGYGRADILKHLTAAARNDGIRVVAVVPVNNFKEAWDRNPGWRSKMKNGRDYIPLKDTYLLSAWHPEFRLWLGGFYKDFFKRNPHIDGLEAMEPMVDYKWNRESDYNPEANKKFASLYPQSVLGDQDWLDFRAQGLTDLIGILNSTAHSFKKQVYLVQTLPARSDGRLFSSQVMKDNTGLDLEAVLNFGGPNKLSYMVAELMWQQWAAEYGTRHFSPGWTRKAAVAFVRFVDRRSVAVVHLELSSFDGAAGTKAPTRKEFVEALRSIRNLDVGITVYDYRQVAELEGWEDLSAWY